MTNAPTPVYMDIGTITAETLLSSIPVFEDPQMGHSLIGSNVIWAGDPGQGRIYPNGPYTGFSPKQMATLIRQMMIFARQRGESATATVGPMWELVKQTYITSPNQPFTLIVSFIFDGLQEEQKDLPLTTRGLDFRDRLIAALNLGRTMGRGQERFDASVRTADRDYKRIVANKLAVAETRGQFTNAMRLVNSGIGTINYNVDRDVLVTETGEEEPFQDAASLQRAYDNLVATGDGPPKGPTAGDPDPVTVTGEEEAPFDDTPAGDEPSEDDTPTGEPSEGGDTPADATTTKVPRGPKGGR